ncbi:type II secretion system protein [Desulfitobacterium hafniense DCB-2]|uniref:Type II secretion system protein n=1 Tax=Desulfitobacterium hafniense (strain DSM 10664 / DCB-2) TaxID=272564 RepID=B8FQ83_DESHD|nr:type II secretion system F family protein [Desulfitobacterium hafniense]ACL21544.1 type II secretion system protein [Desulfitobacterium hafniense DCB-2]
MRSRSFAWRALDQEGNHLEGIWEVRQEGEVRHRLFLKGYYPLAISPRHHRLFNLLSYFELLSKKSDRLRIWAGITQRLSLLLGAGLPLLLAIDILEKQSKGRITRLAWGQVKEQLEAGAELSEALNFLVPPPTPYIRAMAQAGERAGRLPEILDHLSRDLFEEHTYRRKLKGTLTYPVFLLVLTIGLIYALSFLVLPVYEQIFLSMDAELPVLTQVIFRVSHGLPFLVLGVFSVGMSSVLLLRLRHLDDWRERLRGGLSKVPFLGRVYQLYDYLQFSQILGTLLDAGIPLLEALRLTYGAVLTFSMKKVVADLEEAVRAGKRLTAVLAGRSDFPGDATQMLEVGEESGQLSTMLYHLSRLFRMELEEQMTQVPHLVGPLLVIVLAGIIGLVAIGVLLPIFDIGTYLQ